VVSASYTEEDLIRALEAIVNSVSQYWACRDYRIPRSTLQSRIYGHKSHQEAAISQQRLSAIQEKRLTDWVLVQEALGLCPTHSQIRTFAQRILTMRGDSTSLGKRWVCNFMNRNPILKTKRDYKVDSVRVNGATSDIIKAWFRKLDLPEVKAIKPSNRWNIDEAGIMEGQGVNGLVVGSKNRRFVQKKQPGSRVWTSFIEAISALGLPPPPCHI